MNKDLSKLRLSLVGTGITLTSNSNSIVNKRFGFSLLWFSFAAGVVLLFSGSTAFPQSIYQNNNLTQPPPSQNYLAASAAFRQEIARLEINVARPGKALMSITEVPRLQKGDVLKVRMLDEPVNGLKPDQSNYEWTFLVAFLNPGRNTDRETSLSEEIRFRKTGWYKQYSFNVPYDSQPIFFIYPKPEYRAKILNLISKNQDEIRKIGEKTIEISGAYAKIGTFLNELQSVVNRNQYYRTYSGYGGFYGGYGNTNQNFFMEQAVERLARSFNINLPNCWQGGGYNNYGGYNNGTYNNYGSYNNNYGAASDFAGRVQCVAKSVRLEDFDLSVSRMLQQGGILAAAQLTQKYPQLAFWINIAAVALDFILKITNKTPLKLVPTIISTSEYRPLNSDAQNNRYPPGSIYADSAAESIKTRGVKISLFAESSPNDNGFVTAYPLVVHKWQPDSDPEIINLPTPMLAEMCLREGQNFLRNTDLSNDWLADSFTKDFRLLVVSSNGFRKEFSLTKNLGLSAWELSLTKNELNILSKINAPLEAAIIGKRGFNEVRSQKFGLPLASTGNWTAEPQSVVAGATKRSVILKNPLGCRCLQAVIYKKQTGEQVVFETNAQSRALNFHDDTQVSFELDASQSGAGQLELRFYSGETKTLKLNLFPPLPIISDFKIARGDREATVFGSGLEQIQAIKINGRRAIPIQNETDAPIKRESIYENQMPASNGGAKTEPIEKRFVFEEPTARQDSGSIFLEIELEGNRFQAAPKSFSVIASRPAIAAAPSGEISIQIENLPESGKASKNTPKNASNSMAFLSLNVGDMSFTVQNALTDYDFNKENIRIETRIENSPDSVAPRASFEVLDWKNLRVSIPIGNEARQTLTGRRLQFRIRDRNRGDSDWYTIKQLFVRTP